jgi:hypothetical protein
VGWGSKNPGMYSFCAAMSMMCCRNLKWAALNPEVGLDVQFLEVHRFFVQDPGACQVEIVQAAANELHMTFGFWNDFVQGLLQGIQVFEYPVVFQADLQQPPRTFCGQKIIHPT